MKATALALLALICCTSCRCFRPCPQPVDSVVYRDSLIRVPPVTVTDTLPIEVVKWDTITQLVTIRVPETFTSKEREGLRVSARFTPSGIEVKATKADTVFKVQTVERTRVVTVMPEQHRWAWLKWMAAGFGLGIMCVIGLALILRR